MPTLFNSPIIGLTGSPAQIDQVKKQYGIFAEPSPHPMPGKEMEHTRDGPAVRPRRQVRGDDRARRARLRPRSPSSRSSSLSLEPVAYAT